MNIIDFAKKYQKIIFCILLIYMLVIFIMSDMPVVPKQIVKTGINAYILHFIEFGVLGLLSYLIFLPQNGIREKPFIYPVGTTAPTGTTAMFGAIFLASLYAVLDEVHQFYVPGRVCSVLDSVIDIFGVIVFVLLAYFMTPNKLK